MTIPGKFPFAPIVLLYQMVWRNGGVSRSRVALLAAYTVRYMLLEPFRLAEIFVYHRKIRSHVPAQPPIFILGHWRSGTSFLQELICRDSRMTSNTIYRSLFADNFYLTEPWLKPLLNFICRVFRLPYSIQRTQLNLDLPAEADMSLCSLCSEYSYTWGHLFPSNFDHWIEKTILEEGSDRSAWAVDYDYFIRKLSFRSPTKRVVVKSPGDTGRVSRLLRQYPDALFIYVHRDPFAVFHSNLYFWKVLQRQVSLQQITDRQIEKLIIENYRRILSAYLDQRKVIPTNQLAEVRLEDLADDPVRQLQSVYEKLRLDTLPAELTTFAIDRNRSHVMSYATSFDLGNKLRKEWSFAFEKFPG